MRIKEIKEVFDVKKSNATQISGDNDSQLGMSQILSVLPEWGRYDGFFIKTDTDNYMVLINNDQSCCENWGYFSTEDDFDSFIGAELLSVRLTDTALKKEKVENAARYLDCGGIQFVDFETSEGVFQLVVYNSHNGYYGHKIMVVKNNEILLKSIL